MADDEQFSLCWNNFNSNLSAGFHESLCRGDLVDVTLAAEGQFVKAHRLVLSVCSPYFRKMFTQMPANQHAFVFLKDVSHSALKDLIQFMYCGEVNVKQEALPAFISTAEALQIKGLTDGDPAPSQSPAKPSTPAPQPVQPAQTITTQTLSSPRVRQRSSTSRTYRIETDDSDDKSPQIVLQTTTVSQQTQPTIVQSSTTTTVNASQKRVAPRSITAPQSKRVKNVTDPLEAAEPTQISVQTVSENKATNETEFIDLPIEIPTKSEPDYAEEAGEVETAEQDATYVEDDTYADMKYDESYFTENEEGGTTSGGAGTATTSTAVVKQSFVDNSYVEQSEQSAGEAQEQRPVRRCRMKKVVATVPLTEKLEQAVLGPAHNAVYVSTTKGAMKIYYEGHHFKYIFRRGPYSLFQCCYNENNDQCLARVVVKQNLTYHLDGEHSHYNLATDKSVTSMMFEATQTSNIPQPLVEECEQKPIDVLNTFAFNVIELGEDTETKTEQLEPIVSAHDFRERIKKRLQKAILKKKI